jgi:hypothetical protein
MVCCYVIVDPESCWLVIGWTLAYSVPGKGELPTRLRWRGGGMNGCAEPLMRGSDYGPAVLFKEVGRGFGHPLS